jgi:hypothetical protein
LFTLTKLGANRDITEFGVAQIIDILFWNWFQVDPIFIVPNSEEENESATKRAPKVQVVGSNKIL